MSLDPEKLRFGLIYIVTLVLSVCVHEFGHAFVADKLGDPLPRSQGRVTLNPLAHIDLIGTLLLPLVAVFSGPAIGSRIMGWGKPVQISLSARSMTRKISIRTSHALIAMAGPFMNILFALVMSIVYVGLIKTGYDVLADGVANVIFMNIGLCFFNLLPIPPLDGGAVLRRIVPHRFGNWLDPLDKYGFMILFALLMTRTLGTLLWPATWVSYHWVLTLQHWALAWSS